MNRRGNHLISFIQAKVPSVYFLFWTGKSERIEFTEYAHV